MQIRSIGMRVILLVALMVAVMAVIFFTLYSVNQHERAVEKEVKAARTTVLMAESVRERVADKWRTGLFTPKGLRELPHGSDEELREKVLSAVPVVTAWRSAQAKQEELGYEFRTPREGARNPKNEPDAVEAEVLERFRADPGLEEDYVIDESMNAVRYFRPVRLGEVCLNCHGDPADSERIWGRTDGRDITGHRMENKSVGDLHGAFEVIRPLDETDAAISRSLLVAGVLAAVLLAAGMALLAWMLRRSVGRPVHEVVEGVELMVSSRDLSRRLEAGRQDELGELIRAFNRLVQWFDEVVGSTRQSVGKIGIATDEMAGSAESSKADFAEQEQQLEHIASAMSEMAASVQEVAGNTGNAEQAAGDAARQVDQGRDLIQQVARSMDELGRAVDEAAGTMDELNDQSHEIEKVLEVINGISEQTNLLALNAAIEAARAGEHGRGFAVVADEVRLLARRTQDSTGEIRGMIERLQSGAEKATGVMHDGRERARSSQEVTRKAVASLDEIAGATTTISEMNSQISTAAEEQSQVAHEMDTNIAHIAGLSERSTRAAERNVDEAMVIGEQINKLSERIGAFHVSQLDLSPAKLGHVAWRSRLRAFLEDREDLDESKVTSDHECNFGKWYFGEGRERFSHIPEIDDIEKPHAEFHRLVGEIVRLKKAGRLKEAREAFQRLDEISGEIIRLLDAIEDKSLRESGH